MAKDSSLGSSISTIRSAKEGKSGKKRKAPTSTFAVSSTGSGKSASRLELDDIFSTLPADTKKKRDVKDGKEEKGNEGRLKKKPKLASDTKGKGKNVSALDLLIGSSSSLIKSSPQAKSKTSSTSKTKSKPQTNPDPEVTTASISTCTPQSTGSSTISNSNPNSSVPNARLIDPTPTLKCLKAALRTLITCLTDLSNELVLVDRIWYKNASQFKSALWWSAFNSSRRSLHKLLLASPNGDGGLQAQGLSGESVKVLSLVYAGLGGGVEAVQIQKAKLESSGSEPSSFSREGDKQISWATIPKFETKPTPTTLAHFITSEQGTTLIKHANKSIEIINQALTQVESRSQITATVLLKHINTPPAPTFTPLVASLLASMASIHGLSRELIEVEDTEAAEEEEKKKKSPIPVLKEVLNVLSQL